MEACGSSFLGPLISQVNEVFTGKRVYWNYEISRVLACDNSRIFPKGFSSVYYVNPKKVLERPFDKVLILHRPKEEIKADIYNRLGLTEKNEMMDEKVDFYYNLIYDQEITHPKLYRVDLQTFNNYPIAEMSDILDFLGFPKKYRPVFIPIPIWHSEGNERQPIKRNWKKYSTILRKGHEEDAIEKDEYTQVVNVERPNVYKLTPEEYHYQNGRVYRINGELVDVMEVLDLL